MQAKQVQIEESWKQVLQQEFEKDYFANIKKFLVKEIDDDKIIYPPGKLIFNAFNLTPFDKLKVVIIGQDPYHGPGQAMGLCFSVPKNIVVPASLKRIYKELHNDIGMNIPNHGDLTKWANQGVFLLNAILTVEHKSPSSHKKIGWQEFTDNVIKKISEEKEGIIFLLWGNFAKAKREIIDESKHYILHSAHPSPLAGNKFFNNHHFSKTNELLKEQEKNPIDWAIDK
jgi:uracil-DNA glycosylase